MSSRSDALLVQLESALARLDDVLRQPKNEYMRDSAIQRFEFTFELVWKTVKARLEEAGVRAYSPRDSFREAFQVGLIADDPSWLASIELRNLIAHTYNEATAEKIYAALPALAALYRTLLERLKASR